MTKSRKIAFKNDYSEGCHPDILKALVESNLSQQEGYGLDDFCQQAAHAILKQLDANAAKVYFVSGGTQANMLVISSVLRPHESVISAETGHIFVNESGAIEATGHKVSSIASHEGKLTPANVQAVLDSHPLQPHQLKPRLVFISNATELGTVYRKAELQALAEFCRNNDLYLYLDGARLGHALSAEDNDLSLKDIAHYVDAFYLGGTKNGALIGEAIVIVNPALQDGFEYIMKQKGAMLAKGRLLGAQFNTLFKDNLYFDLAQHANAAAMRIKQAFVEQGYDFLADTSTNQIFPILPNAHIELLAKDFDFYVWKPLDDEYSAIRIITSWASTNADVDAFIAAINRLGKEA